MKRILVTGVSSGIGLDLCKGLVASGYEVLGTVRNPKVGEELKASLGSNFSYLILDMEKRDTLDGIKTKIQDIFGEKPLFALVNNAGLAVSGPMELLPMEEIKKQFDVNVFGLLELTQICIPFLKKTDQLNPRIVNISSVSGLITNAFMGPYSASKYAVEAMSDALRRELFLRNIEVIIIEPGPIQTPIWEKARHDKFDWSDTVYDVFLKNRAKIIDNTEKSAIPVAEVTKAILEELGRQKPRTRRIVAAKSWVYPLLRILPDRWVDGIMIKMNGLRKI